MDLVIDQCPDIELVFSDWREGQIRPVGPNQKPLLFEWKEAIFKLSSECLELINVPINWRITDAVSVNFLEIEAKELHIFTPLNPAICNHVELSALTVSMRNPFNHIPKKKPRSSWWKRS